jgi:Carboxylesterase family
LPSAKGANRHGKTVPIADRIGHAGTKADKKREDAGMAGLKSWVAIVAALLATSASAQQSPMLEDIVWKLIEIGRVVDPAKTAALYEPLQEKEPYQGVKVERDIKYGPPERNLLDVFVPDTASSARPVLMFVHGGGFVSGNRRINSSNAFYDNIMLWAVKNGFVGVNITYRLGPWLAMAGGRGRRRRRRAMGCGQYRCARCRRRAHFPDGPFSRRRACRRYVSHPQFHRVKGGGLSGAIMVSGIFDLTTWPVGGVPETAYYGPDTSLYAERSALKGLLATDIPLMFAVPELDLSYFIQQFDLMKDTTCKGAKGCARSVMLAQHSHMSEAFAINTADTRLTDQILEFVKTGK